MKSFYLLISVTVLAYINVFAGFEWQNPKPTGNSLRSISFVSDGYGWICGLNGTLLKTTDDGENWEVLKSPVADDLNGIFFTDKLNGWVVGSKDVILNTTNGGKD